MKNIYINFKLSFTQNWKDYKNNIIKSNYYTQIQNNNKYFLFYE